MLQLKESIENNGGYIHSALALKQPGDTSSRGIFATEDISKGDLLVRLTLKNVISGRDLPTRYQVKNNDDSDGSVVERIASPWLRCLAVLISALLGVTSDKKENSDEIDEKGRKTYIGSLPDSYDTLLHQSSWSNEDVSNFLSGTTLAALVLKDREANSMLTRFNETVVPYLQQCGIIPLSGDVNEEKDAEQLYSLFQQACACISTRGFHLNQEKKETSSDAGDDDDYSGPFLLPFIDLLNHSSIPSEKCTSLQRSCSENECFIMVAERKICKEEEILHSYGDHMASGQILQTFGFVEKRLLQRAVNMACLDSWAKNEKHVKNDGMLTPGSLSRDMVIRECHSIACSSYPKDLRQSLEKQQQEQRSISGDEEDFDEVWSLPDSDVVDQRNKAITDKIIPIELMTDSKDSILSDELITLCCIQFLPADAFEELTGFGAETNVDVTSIPFLTRDILEDYYLGKLVLRAIIFSVRKRLQEYKHIDLKSFIEEGNKQYMKIKNQDGQVLNYLLHEHKVNDENVSQGILKAMFGLSVRIEEKQCLLALLETCEDLASYLEVDDSSDDDDDDDCKSPKGSKLGSPSKRPKEEEDRNEMDDKKMPSKRIKI